MKKILITGCCGFIGSHLCRELLKFNVFVIGVDITFNKYLIYEFSQSNYFYFLNECITKTRAISTFNPDIIIHLAGISNQQLYLNIKGTTFLLEEAVKYKVDKFIYGSSESVYGNQTLPFKESSIKDNQLSPYACSKRSVELLANCYSKLYNLNTIGLRFFSIYGPNKTNIAPYKFIHNILNRIPITISENELSRDYTYITDIINGILKLLKAENLTSNIYNLGSEKSIKIIDFIKECEKICNVDAKIIYINEQLEYIKHTQADCSLAKKDFKYSSKIELTDGLTRLYSWYISQ